MRILVDSACSRLDSSRKVCNCSGLVVVEYARRSRRGLRAGVRVVGVQACWKELADCKFPNVAEKTSGGRGGWKTAGESVALRLDSRDSAVATALGSQVGQTRAGKYIVVIDVQIGLVFEICWSC